MEALGQLTGGIAHDFNNLLTVVVGGLDLIAKQVEDAKLKRYADNALAAAERGARLTGAIARLQPGPAARGAADLCRAADREYAAAAAQRARPGDRRSGSTSTRDLMPVMADPTQLELAVLNLAINARDAMPDGGTLTFATRPVAIADDPELADGDYIELADPRHRDAA